MSEARFDVYVEGTRDASLPGQMKVAAAIAQRYRLAAAQVAETMAKGRFRAGKALDQLAAQRLAQQLEELGAVVRVHPVGAPLPRRAPETASFGEARTAIASSPDAVRTAVLRPGRATPGPIDPGAGYTRAPDPGTPVATRTGPPPGRPAPSAPPPGPAADGGISIGGLSQSPGVHPLERAEPPPAPAAPPPRASQAGLPRTTGQRPGVRDPFAPPDESPLELATPASGIPVVPPSRAAAVAASGRDPFSGPREPALELDVPPRRSPAAVESVAPGADPEAGSADARREREIVRCQTHGLLYDRARAEGCRKCLEGAAPGAAASPAERAGAARRGGAGIDLDDLWQGLVDSPVRRAFLGLALALVLGLVPATYHAWGVNAPEVEGLRARQAELSNQRGTEEVLRAYDTLDSQVLAARSRGMKVTFAIWLVVSSAAGALWYKLVETRAARG